MPTSTPSTVPPSPRCSSPFQTRPMGNSSARRSVRRWCTSRRNATASASGTKPARLTWCRGKRRSSSSKSKSHEVGIWWSFLLILSRQVPGWMGQQAYLRRQSQFLLISLSLFSLFFFSYFLFLCFTCKDAVGLSRIPNVNPPTIDHFKSIILVPTDINDDSPREPTCHHIHLHLPQMIYAQFYSSNP